MLLIFIYMATIVAIKQAIKPEILRHFGFGMFKKTLEPEENLPNFHDALPARYIDRLIKQTRYLHETYGLEIY